MNISILSAGAAKALVQIAALQLQKAQGIGIEGSFGAVGAMQEKLFAGEACDLLILSEPMIKALADSGKLLADSCALIGTVQTGLAVAAGAGALPSVRDAQGLAHTLTHASAIYLPDPAKATAGIHFKRVLEKLGLFDALSERLRPFPNGAAAMQEMAQRQDTAAIGCTQVTEILYTPGVRLIGVLPVPFALATRYALGIPVGSRHPEAAQALAELLTGPLNSAQRRDIGFE